MGNQSRRVFAEAQMRPGVAWTALVLLAHLELCHNLLDLAQELQ